MYSPPIVLHLLSTIVRGKTKMAIAERLIPLDTNQHLMNRRKKINIDVIGKGCYYVDYTLTLFAEASYFCKRPHHVSSCTYITIQYALCSEFLK